jgi:hypothetical protein
MVSYCTRCIRLALCLRVTVISFLDPVPQPRNQLRNRGALASMAWCAKERAQAQGLVCFEFDRIQTSDRSLAAS